MSKTIALSALVLTLVLVFLKPAGTALAGPRGGNEALNRVHYTYNKYYRRDNCACGEADLRRSHERRQSHPDRDAISVDASLSSMTTTSDRLPSPLHGARR